jgi:tRNA threonylcarbamoyladenosine biosynthesis protein TsaB
MLILALDTATAICAAGLFDAGQNRMVAEISETIGIGHAEKIMPMLEAVLRNAQLNLQAIDLVAAMIGPGSFTGVRTGLAAAQGLVQGLGILGAGVTSLEAIAEEGYVLAANKPLRIVINANRGEVHVQDFGADTKPLNAPRLLSVEQAAEKADNLLFAGNGAGLVLDVLRAREDGAIPNVILPDASTGSLTAIATIAHRKWLKSQQSEGASLTLSPLYLRGADAKPQTGFALART